MDLIYLHLYSFIRGFAMATAASMQTYIHKHGITALFEVCDDAGVGSCERVAGRSARIHK